MIKRIPTILILATFFNILISPARADADLAELQIYDLTTQKLERSFDVADLTDGAYRFNLALLDLGGDGRLEIMVSSGRGGEPWIKIFDSWGNLINKFLAYNQNFTGGVSLAAADLDGDKKSEILTAAGAGGGPHVRILDGYGRMTINAGFFTGDKNDLAGTVAAVGDVNGDEKSEIVVWNKSHGDTIKIYDLSGKKLTEFKLVGLTVLNQVKTIDFDSKKGAEIMVSSAVPDKPRLQIYNGQGVLQKEIFVTNENVSGGLNFSVFKDSGGIKIAAAGGLLSAPAVSFYNSQGEKLNLELPAFAGDYLGGVQVAVGDVDGDKQPELVVLQERIKTAKKNLAKQIEIDISEQKLRYYQQGYLMEEQTVSTGKVSMPTPLGEFKVINKREVAYSSRYKLYMPHWLGFTVSGAGIHGLPYWQSGKNKIYEGVAHLGKRVSHGCIRLSLGAAEQLFNWAEVGTPVGVVK